MRASIGGLAVGSQVSSFASLAAANFAHQFLTSYTEEYVALARALKEKPELLGLLSIFKTHLAKDTYHQNRVEDVMFKNREIVRELFHDFFNQLFPGLKQSDRADRHLDQARKMIEADAASGKRPAEQPAA